jgi:hypothetical protein
MTITLAPPPGVSWIAGDDPDEMPPVCPACMHTVCPNDCSRCGTCRRQNNQEVTPVNSGTSGSLTPEQYAWAMEILSMDPPPDDPCDDTGAAVL